MISHWSGYVNEVLESTIKIIVFDQSHHPQEEWELNIDELRPDQRPALVEGRMLEITLDGEKFSLEFLVA